MFGPGKLMMGGMKRPPKIESYSTGTNSFSKSLVIAKPSGTVAGDLLVAIMYGCFGSFVWSGPSGWTEVADSEGMRVAYLVAGASEGASYTFTLSTTGSSSGIIYRISNGDWDTVGSIAQAASGALTLGSITAVGGILIAAFGTANNSGTWTTPSGMVVGVSVKGDADFITFTQDVVGGATGTRASSYSVAQKRVGVLLSIKAK